MIKRETKLLSGLAALLAFGFALTWALVGGPPEVGGENLPPETGPPGQVLLAEDPWGGPAVTTSTLIKDAGAEWVFSDAEEVWPQFSWCGADGNWYWQDAKGTIRGTGDRVILILEHDPKAPGLLILPEDRDNRGRWIQRAPIREELEAWLRFTGVAVVRSGAP